MGARKEKIILHSIVGITLLYHLIVVFWIYGSSLYIPFSDIPDAKHYIDTANNFLAGDWHNIENWWLWPVGFPLFLAGLFTVADWIDVGRIELVLILYAVMHAISIYMVYTIGKTCTGSAKRAIIISIAFMLIPTETFYSATLMSDAPATFCLIIGVYCMTKGNDLKWIIFSALSLALCGYFRPSTALVAALFPFGYLISKKKVLQWKPAIIFSVCFGMFLIPLFIAERIISNGRLNMMSPNGAIAMMNQMCKPFGFVFMDGKKSGDKKIDSALEKADKYAVLDLTIDEFTESLRAISTKSINPNSFDIREKYGSYYIFKNGPEKQTIIKKAAIKCIQQRGVMATIKQNAEYALWVPTYATGFSDEKLMEQLGNKEGILIMINYLLMIIGIMIFLMRDESKVSRISIMLVMFALVPAISSLIFTSVARYYAPFIFAYLILACLPFKNKREENTSNEK